MVNRIVVKRWMMQLEKNPMPFRTMEGAIIRETAKAYLMQLHGVSEPATHCLHCGRELTHKISLYLGIGPVCSGLMYNVDVPDGEIEAIVAKMRMVIREATWEGWVPKRGVKTMASVPTTTINYLWHGRQYRYHGADPDAIRRIQTHATIITIETA